MARIAEVLQESRGNTDGPGLQNFFAGGGGGNKVINIIIIIIKMIPNLDSF